MAGTIDENDCDLTPQESIHSDEGLTLETSVFESVANSPYRPCGFPPTKWLIIKPKNQNGWL